MPWRVGSSPTIRTNKREAFWPLSFIYEVTGTRKNKFHMPVAYGSPPAQKLVATITSSSPVDFVKILIVCGTIYIAKGCFC